MSVEPIPICSFVSQRGAIALVTSLILMLLATIGTAYVTKTSVTDQRLSSNSLLAKAAFESAEAGFNFAVGFMNVDARDLDSDGTDDRVEMLTALGIANNDDMNDGTGREFDDCDINGDGACAGSELGTGNGYRLQAIWDENNQTYSWSLPSTAAACDADVSGNNVRICLRIERIDDLTKARVTVTGFSDW